MPRGLTVAQKAILATRLRRPAYFVKLDLAAGAIRAWNGVGDVTLLSQVWKGVGEYGIIQGIEHDRGLKASNITLGLAGLPGSAIAGGAIAATRGVRYQGRPLTVYFGFCHVDTDAPLADPVAIWSGFADVMTFQLGSTISVSLTGEHLSSLLRKTNGLRMTTESHNTRLGNPSPRDLFFEAQDRLMGQPRPVTGA